MLGGNGVYTQRRLGFELYGPCAIEGITMLHIATFGSSVAEEFKVQLCGARKAPVSRGRARDDIWRRDVIDLRRTVSLLTPSCFM